MMKKLIKLFVFSLLVFGICFFAGCKVKQKPIADPIDKQYLFNYYTQLKQLRGEVLVQPEDPEQSLYGQMYITSELNSNLDKTLTNILNILKNESATNDEISEALDEAKQLTIKIKLNKKAGEKLADKNSYLLSLSLLDVSHLPEPYRLFFNEYAKEKINSLASLENFSFEEFNVVRTLLQDLISFMNEDEKGQAKPSLELDYCTVKNPFLCCRSTLSNLPENNSVFNGNIGEPKNHLKDVRAKDFVGKDISAKVYFKQIADANSIYQRQFQIAVVDDYGNETISTETYTIINSALNSTSPTIVIPKEKEIVSQGKLLITDVRDYVLATDSYGIRIPNNNIDYKVYYTNGNECTTEFNSNKNPGSYIIYFTAHDNYGHVSETLKKEIIVTPRSEDFHSKNEKIVTSNMINTPVFSIAGIDKLNEFKDLNSKLYYRYGTNYPLASRSLQTGISPKATDRNVILLDNVAQYLDGKYQFDGFHQMSYDLYPYLEGVVYKNGLGNIQIPERTVINQFHRNGVKVYGYINIPFAHLGGQVKDLELLFAKNETGFANLDILSNLPQQLGFDGWCFDIQTAFYENDNNISTLPLAKQQEYEKTAALSKKKVEDYILPFFEALKNNLQNNHQDLLMVAGINDLGTINEASKYNSDEYIKISKTVTKFITSPYTKSGNITILSEQASFKTDNNIADDKLYDTFYKGVITNHANKNDVTLRDFLSFLDDNNRLQTSLCLFDLSSRLFSIKLHSGNFQKLDPTSPSNYYGSNNYFKYYGRLQNFIYPNTITADSAAIARLTPEGEDTSISTRDRFFALGELVNPRVMQTNEFYSSMSSLNGYKHFTNNVEDADFTNRKTFFVGGGVNNGDVQGIPLTWTKYNNNPDTKVTFDFNTPTKQGFSSVKINSCFKTTLTKNELSLWGLKFVPTAKTSIYAGIKINDTATFTTDYQVSFKLDYVATDGTSGSLISTPTAVTSLIANSNYQYLNDSLDISNISYISKISLVVETNTPIDKKFELNLLYFYLGDKDNFNNVGTPGQITNITIDTTKGFTNNTVCNAFVNIEGFDLTSPLSNNQYYFYQEKKDGSRVYLNQSYYGKVYLENIIRYATAPVNPKFPTLAEYDSEAKIIVVCQNPQGGIISQGEVTFSWPTELVKGGYAKVKLSSKIAKVNEAITITPIIDELTESVQFEFDNTVCQYQKIPGTEAYVVKFIKEGFYGFKYTTTNPYGKDELVIEHGITISNVIEKETDITSDATIDDSEEMKGIKYSNFVNNAERPRYLIDTDHTGGRNLGTKWCSNDKSPDKRWVIIDFNDPVTITRFELAHCACSLTNSFDKGSVQFNTREYEILVSLDGENWKRVVHRENNYKTFTTDVLEEPVQAKHIKLNVINGGDDITARVYDMRIFGSR